MNQTCRTLLKKQGRTHKRCTLMDPTHGRAKAGRPARTYIQQLCEDTVCCPEDLPRAMNDRGSDERGSGISVLPARHDDDDDEMVEPFYLSVDVTLSGTNSPGQNRLESSGNEGSLLVTKGSWVIASSPPDGVKSDLRHPLPYHSVRTQTVYSTTLALPHTGLSCVMS